MSIRKFKSFISLVIGFFLLIGNFNVQAWSSFTNSADTRIEGCFISAISEEKDVPVFPPIIPISTESEADEEIGKEELDGSDSELVRHFLSYLNSLAFIGGEIEANHRIAFVDLPRYMLFHCWRSFCLSIF